jgi:glycosyltransferase involved in cell wall biosynthesis
LEKTLCGLEGSAEEYKATGTVEPQASLGVPRHASILFFSELSRRAQPREAAHRARLNILLAHNFYQQAGGEDQVFADEGHLLESRGHQVTRYTVNNDAIPNMGALSLAAKTIWNRQTYAELRILLQQQRIDVVHFQNTFPLISPSAYSAGNRAGAAVVQELPNYRLLCANALMYRDGHVCEDCLGRSIPWPGLLHRCYRGSLAATSVVTSMLVTHRALGTWQKRVDAYIALTEFGKEKFIAGGLPAAKISVKGNFVYPDPGVAVGEGDYAVFVGRLSPEKGIETLLKAWEILRGQPGRPLGLKILGDGPMASNVREAAASNPLVQWLGRRPMNDVLEMVGNAMFLVCPSHWHETGGPKTVLEAFAKGTPVVASRLGIMQYVVDHGRTGLHFEAANPTDLARQARLLADDADLRARMRLAARSEFESKYTADQNYRLLMQIYERAIAGRRLRRGGEDKPITKEPRTVAPTEG